MSIQRSKKRSKRRHWKQMVTRTRQQAANRKELLRGLQMETLEQEHLRPKEMWELVRQPHHPLQLPSLIQNHPALSLVTKEMRLITAPILIK